ncbi:MAG TPA: CoA pyrophosphatase [Kofleriaceae bacterium]
MLRTAGLIDALAARMTLGDVQPLAAAAGEPAPRQAAVAIVLHGASDPRVLLMKRVERDGDPWSGHISLPGGGYQASDADLRETAIRETREEMGIDLAGARVLGNLPRLHPRAAGPRGGPKAVEVTPFVFVTEVALEPVCGPEALAAFWLPLELAVSGALELPYRIPNTELDFPSWRFDGHVIWGLTRRILDDLLAVAGVHTGAPVTVLGR